MEKFIFEFDNAIHGICFRYTIVQFENSSEIKYAAGVAIIFDNEEFQMLSGNVFNDVEEAKVYLQQLYFSKMELEKIFLNQLIQVK